MDGADSERSKGRSAESGDTEVTVDTVVQAANKVHQFFEVGIRRLNEIRTQYFDAVEQLSGETGKEKTREYRLLVAERDLRMKWWQRHRSSPPVLRPGLSNRQRGQIADTWATEANRLEEAFIVVGLQAASTRTGAIEAHRSMTEAETTGGAQEALIIDGFRLAQFLNNLIVVVDETHPPVGAEVRKRWPQDLAALTGAPLAASFGSSLFRSFAVANATLIAQAPESTGTSILSDMKMYRVALGVIQRFDPGMPLNDFLGVVTADLLARDRFRRTLQTTRQADHSESGTALLNAVDAIRLLAYGVTYRRIGQAFHHDYAVPFGVRGNVDGLGQDLSTVILDPTKKYSSNVFFQYGPGTRSFTAAAKFVRRDVQQHFPTLAQFRDVPVAPSLASPVTSAIESRFDEMLQGSTELRDADLSQWSVPEIAHALRSTPPGYTQDRRDVIIAALDSRRVNVQRPRAVPRRVNAEARQLLFDGVGLDTPLEVAFVRLHELMQRPYPFGEQQLDGIRTGVQRVLSFQDRKEPRFADIVFLSEVDLQLFFDGYGRDALANLATIGGYQLQTTPEHTRDVGFRQGNEFVHDRFVGDEGGLSMGHD